MNLTVLGATGPTGAEVVRQAIGAGHETTALARHPAAMAQTDPRLRVVRGDATNGADVHGAIAGSDAVLSALGSREMSQPTTIYSASAAAVSEAMRATGARRFIAVSAVPVISERLKTPLNRYVLDPLLHRFFGGGYDDMRRMEAVLAASDLDWTVFRPPYLTNAAARGRFRTALDGSLPRAFSISRADLAAAMLAAIDDRTLVRHAVTIAY